MCNGGRNSQHSRGLIPEHSVSRNIILNISISQMKQKLICKMQLVNETHELLSLVMQIHNNLIWHESNKHSQFNFPSVEENTITHCSFMYTSMSLYQSGSMLCCLLMINFLLKWLEGRALQVRIKTGMHMNNIARLYIDTLSSKIVMMFLQDLDKWLVVGIHVYYTAQSVNRYIILFRLIWLHNEVTNLSRITKQTDP